VWAEWVVDADFEAWKEKRLDQWAKEVADLRVLPVVYKSGKRFRDLGETLDLCSETPSLDSFPVGPRTTITDMRAIERMGLTWRTCTTAWVDSVGIPRGDRSIFEMEVIGEALHAFTSIDQLNVGNLVGISILLRRRAVIIEAHRLAPANPDYSASEVMMGLGPRRGNAEVAESLQSYTAGVLRDRAAVSKEKRKAQEEMKNRLDKKPPPAGGGPK